MGGPEGRKGYRNSEEVRNKNYSVLMGHKGLCRELDFEGCRRFGRAGRKEQPTHTYVNGQGKVPVRWVL